MPVTPDSILADPMAALYETLADCQAFRTWCGVDSGPAAKEHIHYHSVQLKPDPTYPIAIIEYNSGWQAMRDAGGAANTFVSKGSLRLSFEAKNDLDPDAVLADVLMTFLNDIGDILEDLLAIAGSSGYLNITSIVDAGSGPAHPRAKDGAVLEEIWGMEFIVEWSQV